MSASLDSRAGAASALAAPRPARANPIKAPSAPRPRFAGLEGAEIFLIRPTICVSLRSRGAEPTVVDDFELILDFRAKTIFQKARRGRQHCGAGKALQAFAQVV